MCCSTRCDCLRRCARITVCASDRQWQLRVVTTRGCLPSGCTPLAPEPPSPLRLPPAGPAGVLTQRRTAACQRTTPVTKGSARLVSPPAAEPGIASCTCALPTSHRRAAAQRVVHAVRREDVIRQRPLVLLCSCHHGRKVDSGNDREKEKEKPLSRHVRSIADVANSANEPPPRRSSRPTCITGA